MNVAGVLAALGRQPGALLPLIRLAARTGSARATLVRLRPIITADLGSPRPTWLNAESYSAPAA